MDVCVCVCICLWLCLSVCVYERERERERERECEYCGIYRRENFPSLSLGSHTDVCVCVCRGESVCEL